MIFDDVEFLLPIEEVEPSAMEQIKSVAATPFVLKMAVMPDVHAGYDMPIGSVALTRGMVCPGWVGYDIGCGVASVDTGVQVSAFLARTDLEALFSRLYQVVPVGTNRFKDRPTGNFRSALGDPILDAEVQANQQAQLGTLGSGNHFLEFGSTNRGTVAITVHSGSRNLGHRICTHYLKWGTAFPLVSHIGLAYMSDMAFALTWALENRKAILIAACAAAGLPFFEHCMINENHNHAEHIGVGVLHRKGATSAMKGQLGLVPGNMRDGVYVTRGLGNRKFLCSASHGAGRAMGRKAAERSLSMEEFHQTMLGIKAKVTKETLDEAPMAYKSLELVMARQDGVVVSVVDHIKPFLNIKG